ncbi:MAG: fenitrothion hydrolase [Acidobacteria bacterium]|nr:fenitrothion hydrolase [Acidobacteriota bacterium]
MRKVAAAAVVAPAVMAVVPDAAVAHGIGQRADLPIPVWLFAWGAAIVLVASFVALAVLWRRPVLAGLPSRALFSVPAVLEWLAGALGVASFAVIVWAGLAGNQTATANLAPTAIFVLVWVGIPFASVLFGDVFSAVSPWRAVGRGVGWAAGRISGGLPSPIPYPERLGRWPAAFGILLFAWIELVWSGRESPSSLAAVALAYAVVMLVGMSCFGVEKWTRNADAFGVAFGLFALLAPLEWSDRRCRLRWPVVGALSMPEVPGAAAVLVVLIGSTSFDGFSQGGVWTGASGLAQRLTDGFAGIGLAPEAAVQAGYTVGLVLVVAVVAGLYRVAVLGMARAGGSHPGAERLSLSFAHTLIPIAFAYLVAHYFSLLAFQGQATAFLASDPLGNGWDLLGTASATIDYGILSANAIWYVQVAALVLGHVAALALAHDRALATWSDQRTAVRSQYWMLMVMVAFTCLGLWLLSAAAQ